MEDGEFGIQVVVAVLIVLLYILLGHLFENYHAIQITRSRENSLSLGGGRDRLASITDEANLQEDDERVRKGGCGQLSFTFHESGPAILLGLLAGVVFSFKGGKNVEFPDQVFFYFVLPPIIFYQGYSLKKRRFFRYFHYTAAFGIIGTVLHFIIMTWIALTLAGPNSLPIQWNYDIQTLTTSECYMLGAILSAADEVATLSLVKQEHYPKLSAILFGEGVLNDAVSILLFRATLDMQKQDANLKGDGVKFGIQIVYLLLSALFIGVGIGLVISFMLKRVESMRSYPTRQTAVIMIGGYLSFVLLEGLDMSGILGVFFCGLTLSHYAWHSLSSDAKTSTRVTFGTLSMVAEAYCFASIGMSVHNIDSGRTTWMIVGMMLVAMVIARFVVIFGLNLVGKIFAPRGSEGLPLTEQFVLFAGGIVRGAIAWAQVVQAEDTQNHMVLLSSTLCIIILTTVVFGSCMPYIVAMMEAYVPQERENTNYALYKCWRRLDRRFLTPHFGGRRKDVIAASSSLLGSIKEKELQRMATLDLHTPTSRAKYGTHDISNWDSYDIIDPSRMNRMNGISETDSKEEDAEIEEG